MKYKLVIDKNAEEEIIAVVHAPSSLTQQIETLVCSYTGADSLLGYREDELRRLPFPEIECITVLDGKTWAVDVRGERFRLRQESHNVILSQRQSVEKITG